MYKVIRNFRDNDYKNYVIGDDYENENEERLIQLSTNNNNYGYPFIEKVEVKRTRNKK